MLKLVLRRAAPDTEEFGHAQSLIEGLCNFYDIIKENDMWLPTAVAQEAHDALLKAGVKHTSTV